MSELEPTLISKEQKDGADTIMAMNRKERRRLGKKLGVRIPGTQKPFVKEFAKWTPTGS